MNEVQLAGYLGADPELRYTGQGTAVANARLATDESYTNAQGEQVDQTEWHSLVFWGRKAEVVNEYLSKGDFVIINRAKLQTREWEDRDDNTRYSTEVKVLEFEFGPAEPDMDESEVSEDSGAQQQPASAASASSDDEDTFEPDDELPF